MENKDVQNPLIRFRNLILLFIIILLTVVVILSNRDDIEHALFEVSTTSFASVLILTGLLILFLLLDAFILQVSVDEPNLKLHKAFVINAAGAFFSGVTPLYIGSYPSRLYYLHKHGVSVEKSLAALTVKGITYQMIIVIAGFLAFFTGGSSLFKTGGFFVILMIGFVWNSFSLSLLLLISISKQANKKAVTVTTYLTHRLKFLEKHKEALIEGIQGYYENTRRLYQD